MYVLGDDGEGLGPGAIVGIVLGSIFGLVFLMCFCGFAYALCCGDCHCSCKTCPSCCGTEQSTSTVTPANPTSGTDNNESLKNRLAY